MNFQKQLNNRKPLPEPPTVGTIDQLLISDGQDGTKWSTSLLGQEAACLSAYVSANFVLAITGLPGLQLQSPPVALGLDFSATSKSIFHIQSFYRCKQHNTKNFCQCELFHQFNW